jgi:muramoyltetrapeptide carboxypeptidase LdcA involved in peptidoglycan recycling
MAQDRSTDDAPVTPPPVGDDQSVLLMPTSSQTREIAVDRGAGRLRERFGVAVERSPLLDAGDDPAPRAVADELERAFARDDVGAVVAVTGGDRHVRILEHLDRDILGANPTRFFGISGNTVLHAALASAGVVSYYGGQLIPGLALDVDLPEYTATYVERALFDPELGVIEPAERYTDDYFDFDGTPREWLDAPGWTFDGFEKSGDGPNASNAVSGRLWGGCVTVLQWIAAADPDGDLVPLTGDGRVLLHETSEELPRPARVRRVLQSLGARGTLDGLDAVVVGRPKTRHTESPPIAERDAYRQAQRRTIRDTIDACTTEPVPILFDFDVGHTDPHVPLPISATITIDPEQESVTLTD